MSEPRRDLEGEHFGHTVMQYKSWKSHRQAGHVGVMGGQRGGKGLPEGWPERALEATARAVAMAQTQVRGDKEKSEGLRVLWEAWPQR